jgi:hypothetical protein
MILDAQIHRGHHDVLVVAFADLQQIYLAHVNNIQFPPAWRQ